MSPTGVVDGELEHALRGQTAVLIEGAKGVGKTMTASYRALRSRRGQMTVM